MALDQHEPFALGPGFALFEKAFDDEHGRHDFERDGRRMKEKLEVRQAFENQEKNRGADEDGEKHDAVPFRHGPVLSGIELKKGYHEPARLKRASPILRSG